MSGVEGLVGRQEAARITNNGYPTWWNALTDTQRRHFFRAGGVGLREAFLAGASATLAAAAASGARAEGPGLERAKALEEAARYCDHGARGQREKEEVEQRVGSGKEVIYGAHACALEDAAAALRALAAPGPERGGE